jgi:hypothetical protein
VHAELERIASLMSVSLSLLARFQSTSACAGLMSPCWAACLIAVSCSVKECSTAVTPADCRSCMQPCIVGTRFLYLCKCAECRGHQCTSRWDLQGQPWSQCPFLGQICSTAGLFSHLYLHKISWRAAVTIFFVFRCMAIASALGFQTE